MSEWLVMLGLVGCALSGVVGLCFGRHSGAGQWLSTLVMAVACLLGLAGAGLFWFGQRGGEINLPWAIPGGRFHVAVDGLAAMFLAPIYLIALLGSVYGLSYWKQAQHPADGRKLRLFYGFLPAGMALLVIAQNGLLFLVGWEIMALSAFFLVTTEDQREEVRRAGWIYLLATHFSTLCLFALFALLGAIGGSFDFRVLTAAEIGPKPLAAVFGLALAGFGMKAGVMPLHFWLPGAHAMAPTHVSAMMSGVLIKMGIFGLVRVTSLLPPLPAAWGGAVLALGVVSAVLGVAYAIAQHDLKRLLAYHSIENIGIIVVGLGLALLGRATSHTDWIVLGLGGALLHVWNHALFKALLFLSAGSVIHATHTREIDHFGGLIKLMPWTAVCFLTGAVAICGLPPLNGFVSELFIYLGLLRTLGIPEGPTFVGAALAAPALTLAGALALACFVKVFGAVFLGTPRGAHAVEAHESAATMIVPMLVLSALCFILGIVPRIVSPVLASAIRTWAPEVTMSSAEVAQFAPLGWITGMGVALLAAMLLAAIGLTTQLRRSAIHRGPTWGCGFAAPTARMQYTSSSFAALLVGLFAWALRPKKRAPRDLPFFPSATAFHSDVPDVVLDEGLLPAFRFGQWVLGWFRILQQGNVQMYLLYIFVTLLALLLWR